MYEGITAEALFFEPHLLERYLDALTEETSIPYTSRLKRKGQLAHFSDETYEAAELVDTRESQIKLLINYLNLIIEKSQDKMLTQTEAIEQYKEEIEGLKFENVNMKEELRLFRGSLEELRHKHDTLEEYLQDVEKRYENDKLTFNQTQLEIQILKGIKEELTESKLEKSKLEKSNESLRETLHNLEEKLELLRVENSDLKENFEVLKHNLIKSTQAASEHVKIKALYEKMCRDYEDERASYVMERRTTEENLGLVSERCIQLQEELQKTKSLGSMRRGNTIEDPTQNLNAKLASIEGSLVLDQDRPKTEVSYPSTDDTLEHYAADQFDGIRVNPDSDMAGIKRARQKPLMTHKFNTTEARCCYSPIEENSPRMSDIGTFDGENSGSTIQNTLKPKRKNILEEFFMLTFQSSLLNSEHFNELAGIESSKLYDEANKQDVPYFQWSKWLDEKLEEIYRETILPRRKATRAQKKQVVDKCVIVG